MTLAPATAAPIANPAIPCSLSGVLKTRSVPYFSLSPIEQRNTPPNFTSSPNNKVLGWWGACLLWIALERDIERVVNRLVQIRLAFFALFFERHLSLHRDLGKCKISNIAHMRGNCEVSSGESSCSGGNARKSPPLAQGCPQHLSINPS